MGVGGVTSMNSMSSVQMTMTHSADVKSKKIKNEITEAQQQMQKLSSEQELSIDEKANERKKQQKEITDLNAELKRYQDELLMSQKRERMLAELQKDEEPEKERKSADEINKKSADDKEAKTADGDAGYQGTVIVKNSDGTVILKGAMNQDEERSADESKNRTDETKEKGSAEKEAKTVKDDKDINTGMSNKEIHAVVSADASAQQTGLRGTVIAKIRGGMTVLKGEIDQDERHGVNTDKKQEQLEKLQKKEENAITFPYSSALEKENRIITPAAKIKVSGTQTNTENKAIINISKLSQEEVSVF